MFWRLHLRMVQLWNLGVCWNEDIDKCNYIYYWQEFIKDKSNLITKIIWQEKLITTTINNQKINYGVTYVA